MPKKPKPEPDDAEQSKRFKQAALDVEADKTGAVFRRAVDSLLPPVEAGTKEEKKEQTVRRRKQVN